jgi:predicted DCC family thiol-disulfide oxidoreductase YuxK
MAAEHLILYDGVCGLCDRFVRFALNFDRKDKFRFAALQSAVSRELLARYGKDPDRLDTVLVVVNFGEEKETLLTKGKAALFVLGELSWPWPLFSIFRILPDAILNFFYDLIASNRYRLFGKLPACRIPDARTRGKFIDG